MQTSPVNGQQPPQQPAIVPQPCCQPCAQTSAVTAPGQTADTYSQSVGASVVQSTPIPQPQAVSAWFRVNCPNCGSTLQAQLGPGVSSVQCGSCQYVFPVQVPATATPAYSGNQPTVVYELMPQDLLGISGKIRKKSKPHLCKRMQPDGTQGCNQKAHPNQKQCALCHFCKALCKCKEGYRKDGSSDDAPSSEMSLPALPPPGEGQQMAQSVCDNNGAATAVSIIPTAEITQETYVATPGEDLSADATEVKVMVSDENSAIPFQ